MVTGSDVVNLPHDYETCGRSKKASLRDMLSFMDARVARMELAIGEMQDKFDDTEERIEVLDSKKEELKKKMQGVLNKSMDALTQKDENLEAMMVAIREEMDELKRELTACKKAIGVANLQWHPLIESMCLSLKSSRARNPQRRWIISFEGWRDILEHPTS